MFFDMKGMSLDIKDGGDKVNVFILHSDNQVIHVVMAVVWIYFLSTEF